MARAGYVVFVDYDGTLLTQQRKVSSATCAAIARARENGICVVPASGRPLQGLKIFNALPITTAIALNGAVIQRRPSEPVWEAATIDRRAMHGLTTFGVESGLSVNVYTADAWFTNDSAHTRVEEERQRVQMTPTLLPADGLPKGIHKILLLGSALELRRCERYLEAMPRLGTPWCWFRSEPEYLEIGRADVSKGRAVRIVRGWLQPRRTYAIGDSDADGAMFDEVDVGIAVGNGTSSLKQRADLVVDTNEEDGVADALDGILRGDI